jgi:hypothetical protein
MSDVLPCIACGKALEPVGSGSPNHADDANEFSTHGQYGSTKFDPMDGSLLVVNICDECIVSASFKGRVYSVMAGSREFKPWSARR